MAKQFTCRSCGKASGSDLFCSQACREAADASAQQIAAELARRGFERHPDAPNAFVKDGVFLTMEEVRRNGIDAAISSHDENPKRGELGTEAAITRLQSTS